MILALAPKILRHRFRIAQFGFESGTLDLRLLPLLALRAHTDLALRAYDGVIKTDAQSSLIGDTVSGACDIMNLSLARHPFLSGYSIRGDLSVKAQGKVDAHESRNEALRSAKASGVISIENGSYSGGHTIHGLIKLPEVRNVSATAEVTLENLHIELPKLSLDSSLGSLSGKGYITFNEQGVPQRMNIRAAITLSEIGAQEIGPYFASLSRGDIENPGKHWMLSVFQPENGKPTATLLPDS